jgi:hypothetical protein
MSNISEGVGALLARMESDPNEFINIDWDPVAQYGWDVEPFNDTRWGNLMRVVFTSGNELLFTEEDKAAIKEAYTKLLRERMGESIVKELVAGERLKELQERAEYREKQLNLPYMPALTTNTAQRSLLNTAQINAHNAVLNAPQIQATIDREAFKRAYEEYKKEQSK